MSLNVDFAKMIEEFEWECTLPEKRKSERRFRRFLITLGDLAKQPLDQTVPTWITLGFLERAIHHAEVIYGKDWIEQTRKARNEFYQEEDEDDDQ